MNIHERLTESEVAKVRERIGPTDRAVETRLQDVAEVSGRSAEEVKAQLDSLRAEKAFSAPAPRTYPSAVAIGGVGLLLIGAAVYYVRGRPKLSIFPRSPVYRLEPALKPVEVPPTGTVVQQKAVEYLRDGLGTPPPGFHIEVVGQQAICAGDGRTGVTKPVDYSADLVGLVSATEQIVRQVAKRDKRWTGPKTKGPVRGESGVTVSPRPGFVHYTFQGWLGNADGWLKVPVQASEHAALIAAATAYLAPAKAEQDAALAIVTNSTSEVISPPPGFTIRFFGRRVDIQSGPRLSFSSVSVSQFVARIKLALANAAIRDLHPPLGPWSEPAEIDSKIPVPEMDRVEIDGAAGTVALDLPHRTSTYLPAAEGAKIEKLVLDSVKLLRDSPKQPNVGKP